MQTYQKAPFLTVLGLFRKYLTITSLVQDVLVPAGHRAERCLDKATVLFLSNTVWMLRTVAAKAEIETPSNEPNI